MKKVQDLTGDELLDELGVELAADETSSYTARQERIIAGFEDILRFWEANRRAPKHSHDGDIFERMYAVRLDQLRKLPSKDLALLQTMDTHGLLNGSGEAGNTEAIDDDELLAALDGHNDGDIGVLRHVTPTDARRDAPEQVADRFPCKEFTQLKPLFEEAQSDLVSRAREAKRFVKDASIEQGDFFILSGQLVYVASVGKRSKLRTGLRTHAFALSTPMERRATFSAARCSVRFTRMRMGGG